jgi:hypothetical protein
MKLKKINYTKGFKIKKIKNKRMRMKIEIQNKFYFWLKCEIKNKSQFNKKHPKKFKQSKE